jgi:hypothetical protein
MDFDETLRRSPDNTCQVRERFRPRTGQGRLERAAFREHPHREERANDAAIAASAPETLTVEDRANVAAIEAMPRSEERAVEPPSQGIER